MSTIVMLTVFLVLGMSALLYSLLETRATHHYDTGNQALYAAEAGILQAVNRINRAGVLDLQKDIVQKWGTVFGPATQELVGYPKFSFTVSIESDASSPASRATLTSVGSSPSEGRRTIRSALMRGPTGSGIGALYLAADSVNTDFNGNAFQIDGNDHDRFGNRIAGGAIEPGIATRNESVSTSVRNSLNSLQKDNVQGLGFSLSPLTPSVLATGGPSVLDIERIVATILADPRKVVLPGANLNGNDKFGTLAAPQITHLTGKQSRINGNASGVGILVVDGDIDISGNLDFIGWILVRGETIVNGSTGDTTLLGNATITGSLWTADMYVKVGGSVILDYCSWCMNLIFSAESGGSYVPSTVSLTSWQEIL
jgi:hypothetical protein